MTKRRIQRRMLDSLRSSTMYKHSEVYISDSGKLLPFYTSNNYNKYKNSKTQKSIIYASCKQYVEKYFAMLHTLDIREL
jgi:hypothetical protein